MRPRKRPGGTFGVSVVPQDFIGQIAYEIAVFGNDVFKSLCGLGFHWQSELYTKSIFGLQCVSKVISLSIERQLHLIREAQRMLAAHRIKRRYLAKLAVDVDRT
jgi:hypothetical protein